MILFGELFLQCLDFEFLPLKGRRIKLDINSILGLFDFDIVGLDLFEQQNQDFVVFNDFTIQAHGTCLKMLNKCREFVFVS